MANAAFTWPELEQQCELTTTAIKLLQTNLTGDAADRIVKKASAVEDLQQQAGATRAYVATRQVLAAAELLRERSDYEVYRDTSAGQQFEDAMRRTKRKEIELRRLLEEQHAPAPQAAAATTSYFKPSSSSSSSHFAAATSRAVPAAPQTPSMESAPQRRRMCMLPSCHARALHAEEDCPRAAGMTCKRCYERGHYSRACPELLLNSGNKNAFATNRGPTSSTQAATSSSYSQPSTTTQADPAARFRPRPKKQASFADQRDETPSIPPPAAPPHAPAAAPAPAEGAECCVCFETIAVRAALYKCGHEQMCFDCATRLKQTKQLCPICRATIDDVIRLHG